MSEVDSITDAEVVTEVVSPRPIPLNFPDYVRITQTDVSLNDMGDRTITLTVKADANVTVDFSYDWKMSFRGQVFILPVREPQAVKANTSTLAEYDLTFQHEAIYKLKGEYYIGLDEYNLLWDKYNVPMNLTLSEFVEEYDKVLVHLFGGTIRARLHEDSTIKEQLYVSLSNIYMWDLLQETYDTFGCRWDLEYDAENEIHYINFDYPATEITEHTFEYGFDGGLLSITKGVESDEIYNYILGRGGSDNIPYRYFKATDEDNPDYRQDPDWIDELKYTTFSNLRSKEYRDYVQGYKVKRKEQGVSDYASYARTYEATGRSDAYYQGYTDAGNDTFDPVEYIVDQPSIDVYGIRKVMLDNNDDIYPTIQGVDSDNLDVDDVYKVGRVDEVVAVEQVLADEPLNVTGVVSSADQNKYTSLSSVSGAVQTPTLTMSPISFSVEDASDVVSFNIWGSIVITNAIGR